MAVTATVERTYDLSFSYFAPLIKAYEKDNEMFIVVKASDTSVDRDNERIAPELINKMKVLAKSGQLVLLDHHKATFPMGRSVDVEENPDDPNGFYPVFKLDPDHPYSRYLFKIMKENTADFGVSIGGKYPKVRWTTTPEGRLVAEVYDAEIDHVAFTRRGYEANPNTGIVRAIFKAMREVGIWEKEMNDVLNQITRVVVEQPKQNDEKGEDEKKKREDEFKVAKEALSEAVAAVLNSINPTVTDEQFAKEFQMAVSEAKILNPITDVVIAARETEYGYERGVYACTEPPKVWGQVAEFADPVGYFYPLSPNYIKASLNHFLKVGMNYYLPESAAKVYANLVNAALKAGIPVSYNDNPLLSASLPADLKVKLKDYNPQTDAMCTMLWDAYRVQVIKELVGEDGGDYIKESYIKESRDELLEALREREKKYGYKVLLNANLTKPSRWENVPEDEFADPVGYKYPVHTPRNARAALSYFNKPENRRFYTAEGQIKVLTRIIQACLRHGIKVSFQPEDPLYWLLPTSLKRKLAGYDDVKEQDTEEKRDEMRRKVEQMAVKKVALKVLEWAKGVDEERVVIAVDKAGLKVDRVAPTAVDDAPKKVKVEGVAEVDVKEKPVEVDIKAQKYDITKVEFLIALPVEKFPASLADLNELVSRVKDLGLNFNVVKVDGSKGKITFKAEDGSEITLEKQATVGVWQLRGVGTLALWGLQWAINDALRRRFPERNLAVEDLSADMAIFRDLDTDQLFAVGWKADEVGRVVLSPTVKEVVMTYGLPEDAIECYENLKAALWRPDVVSHADAVEGQVAVAVEVTPPAQP
jgi:hypothetical protein